MNSRGAGPELLDIEKIFGPVRGPGPEGIDPVRLQSSHSHIPPRGGHRVRHAWDDRAAVSIHVYGANIGAVQRHRLDDSGALRDFVSGYDNLSVPNLWDRSGASRNSVRAC